MSTSTEDPTMHPDGPATLPIPEPDLTPREAIRRAEAMRPALIERQAETEALTHHPESSHRELQETGLYRILQPRRFGGYEFEPWVFFKVVIELARGCPSTAWGYTLGCSHVIQVAGIFDEDAQIAMFAPDGEFRAASFGQPVGKAEKVDGGWVLNGKWPYASGSPYSTHFAGHAPGPALEDGTPGPPLLFLMPRDQWTLADDWGDVMGLKGSGSNSVIIENGFVRDDHTVFGDIVNGRADGTRSSVHANPMYHGRTAGLFSLGLAAVATGAAKGALDEYVKIITTRKGTFYPDAIRSDLQDYQRYLGLASGQIATAEAAVIRTAQEHFELSTRQAQEGVPFTPADDLRLTMVGLEAGRLAWQAVQEIVFRTGSSAAAREGTTMQRYWRDLCTYWTHNGPAQNEYFATEYGRVLLGLESPLSR